MIRILLSAYRRHLALKTGIILSLSLMCIVAITRPAAAAGITVSQPSFSPSAVAIGGSFAFAFSLNSNAVVSNTVVAMAIFDSAGHDVLEKDVSGQTLQPGQPVFYSWSGLITPGQTLSDPFANGHYKMMVYVWNANKSSLYMSGNIASLFTVGWGAAAASSAGSTAIAPIPPPAGTGKTYYVSSPLNPTVDTANRALLPTGAAVYSTIQAAANVTQPGDTVLIMNGTYEPTNPKMWVNAVLSIYNSGSPTAYITYAAYPGHHPVITSSNTVNTYDVIQDFASYIVIDGLEVIGSAQNVTLAQANQTGAAESALLQQEAAAGQPATFPSSAAKDVQNGNCIAGGGVTHIILLNNLIHDCSAGGIDFGPSDYMTIEANTVYNTSWWTFYDTSGISIGYAINSDSSTAYKNYVLDNISYNNANTQPNVYDLYASYVSPGSQPNYPTDGEGIIIDTNHSTTNGSPYLGRTLVAGNITYSNGGAGIEIWRSSHVDVINNVAYMNDTCPVAGSTCGPVLSTTIGVSTQVPGADLGQIYATSGSDNNFYNNVMYAPTGKYIYTNWGNTTTIENNNIMYSANGQILTDNYKPAAQDMTSDPLFSNSSAPATTNFVLSAQSPGLGKGIPYSNDNVSLPILLRQKVVNGTVNIGVAQ